MSFIGTLHEISFYGLIGAIISLVTKKATIDSLFEAALHPEGIAGAFLCFLFWASALFIPIAIIGALVTRFSDNGEGLTFNSRNILVILFAHIAEEILGIVMSPFWFIKDLFSKKLTAVKAIDYIVYALLICGIVLGILFLL